MERLVSPLLVVGSIVTFVRTELFFVFHSVIGTTWITGTRAL